MCWVGARQFYIYTIDLQEGIYMQQWLQQWSTLIMMLAQAFFAASLLYVAWRQKNISEEQADIMDGQKAVSEQQVTVMHRQELLTELMDHTNNITQARVLQHQIDRDRASLKREIAEPAMVKSLVENDIDELTKTYDRIDRNVDKLLKRIKEIESNLKHVRV